MVKSTPHIGSRQRHKHLLGDILMISALYGFVAYWHIIFVSVYASTYRVVKLCIRKVLEDAAFLDLVLTGKY